eukprot:CFRG4754T1
MISGKFIALAALAVSSSVNAQLPTIKVGYHESDYAEAQATLPGQLQAVMPEYEFSLITAADTTDALNKLAANEVDIVEADMVTLEPKITELQSVVVAKESDGRTFYDAIALVLDSSTATNLADTRGKRSCHTGFSKGAGMQMPLGWGVRVGVIPEINTNNVETVQAFYTGGSCAYSATDSSLCQNCMLNGGCDKTYSDYEGSLRCLLEGRGDVAFLKAATYNSVCGGDSPAAYCKDATGALIKVRQIERFAGSPSHVITAAKTMSAAVLSDLQAGFLKLTTDFLSGENGYAQKTLAEHDADADLFLANKACFPGATTQTCISGRRGTAEEPLVMAVDSVDTDTEKNLNDYFSANNGVHVTVLASTDEKDVVSLVREGSASFADADAGATVAYLDELESVAVEKTSTAGSTSSYIAQAWVLKSSGIRSFRETKGKRSCHTGFQKSAGMYLPTGWATGRGIMTEKDTLKDSVEDFWSASCALPEITTACPNANIEDYGGYGGALRCLTEGLGDVAFIRDTTFATECENPETAKSWCTKTLNDYEAIATFGESPSHAVVSSKIGIEAITLAALQKKFADMPAGNPAMQYFSTDIGFSTTETLVQHFGSYRDTVACMPQSEVFLGITEQTCVKMAATVGSNEFPVRIAFSGSADDESTLVSAMGEVSGLAYSIVRVDGEDMAAQSVMNRDADIAYLDAANTFTGLQYGMDTVAVEKMSMNGLTYYNAGAIVPQASSIQTFADTKGKKSCHTGFTKSAGMYMPVGYGVRNRIIDDKTTLKETVSSFWSAGQCATPVLCSVCDGKAWTNTDTCPADDITYDGYDGALKCMMEGAGDVAFVRTTSVNDICGVAGAPTWCKGSQEDYRVVQDFGQVPSHPIVLINSDVSSDAQTKMSEGFAKQAAGSTLATIFGTGGFANVPLSQHTADYRANVGCVPEIESSIPGATCVKESSDNANTDTPTQNDSTSSEQTSDSDSDSSKDIAIAALVIAILALVLAPVVGYFVARKMYVRWVSTTMGRHRKFSDPESVTNVQTGTHMNHGDSDSNIPERTV